MFLLKAALLLGIFPTLSRCDLRMKDCDRATTDCCDLAVENIKAKNVKITGECDSYWKSKTQILANFLMKDYECDNWICDCPDFQQKFREKSRYLAEKEADQRCADSAPQLYSDSGNSVGFSKIMLPVVILGLYAVN